MQEEPAGNSGEEAAPSGDSQEEHSGADSQEIPVVPAPDFTLTDQYGQSHTPVSYTHLDVYKRQVLPFTTAPPESTCRPSGGRSGTCSSSTLCSPT